MKLRKATAVMLAGALVLTTFATGATSEAAKSTKLKTKKVSIFVKGKKKISITGKKAKHKYTFTSKKAKIAKVSKSGVITGVKAGKTTIVVKDTWKQNGKKKTKKLGNVAVTVKNKSVTPVVTPAPTQAATAAPSQTPGTTQSAAPSQNPGGTQTTAPSQTPGGTQSAAPSQTPGGTQSQAPSQSPSASQSAAPSQSPNGGTPTPTPTAPAVNLTLDKANIKITKTATATVTVGAGEVQEVKWTSDKTDVATVAKDSTDQKKATITGAAAGTAKITAEVKVKVQGVDFTVTKETNVTVAEFAINASIKDAPEEVESKEAATLELEIDADGDEDYTLKSIDWDITEGNTATIDVDTSSVEKSKSADLTATGMGEVTVSVTVTAQKGTTTATSTATATIKTYLSVVDIDITKNITVAGWGNKAKYEVQDNGKVKITWSADANNYTFAKFNFASMDLTGYWCVIDAEGCTATVEIHDASKTEPAWNNPLSCIAPQYGKSFPFKIELSEANLNDKELKDGDGVLQPVEPDYEHVAGVSLAKGTQKEELVLVVKSIKFYRNESDIPTK